MKTILLALSVACWALTGCTLRTERETTDHEVCPDGELFPIGDSQPPRIDPPYYCERYGRRKILDSNAMRKFERVDATKGIIYDRPFRILEINDELFFFFIKDGSSEEEQTFDPEQSEGPYVFTIFKGETPYQCFFWEENAGYFLIAVDGDLFGIHYSTFSRLYGAISDQENEWEETQ